MAWSKDSSRKGCGVGFALLMLCWSLWAVALPGKVFALAGWGDDAKALTVTTDGGVAVTGYSETADDHYDLATVKYGSDGQLAWVQRIAGGYTWGSPAAITSDATGSVYVTGIAFNPASASYDYVTVKYSADGQRVWIRYYDGPGNGTDSAYAIALDNFGNVLVTGGSSGGGTTNTDYATVKYSPTGERLWVRRYDGPAHKGDTAVALGVDSQNGVYVTGYSWGGDDYRYDWATIKYKADGEQQWVNRYEGRIPGVMPSEEYPVAMAVTSQGNVYITGSPGSWELPDNEDDYVTIGYDTDGEELWRMYYDGPEPGADRAAAIVADSEGFVYVTGSSYQDSTTGTDYVTIKYRGTNGNPVWTKRFKGPGSGSDRASALTLDGKGTSTSPGDLRCPIPASLMSP